MALAIALAFLAFGLFVFSEMGLLGDALSEGVKFSAVALAGSVVVLTYVLGGRQRYQKDWQLFQPLKGGIRFIVFQIIGWTCFGLFLVLPAVPYFLATMFPEQTFRGIAISAGAAAILSEVSLVASMLFYRPKQVRPELEKLQAKGFVHGFQGFVISSSGRQWWTSFLGIQVLLTLIGLGLSVTADFLLHSTWAWIFVSFFAFSCFVFSAFATYGIGGPWKHYLSQWRFYQPGIGGFKFVVLQGLSWALFSISLCIFIAHFLAYTDTVRSFLLEAEVLDSVPTLVTAGITALLSQLLLTTSLFYYNPQGTPPTATQDPAWLRVASVAAVAFIYNLQIFVAFGMVASFVLASTYPNFFVVAWTLGWIIYPPTYFWSPGVTGRRQLQPESYQWLMNLVVRYFDLKIFRDFKGTYSFDNGEKYILGYHPHGLLPFSCAWMTKSALWKKLIPELSPGLLTASITHVVPLMRDLGHYMGGFEVTLQGFLSALHLKKCALLVPGGQMEMTYSRSDTTEMTLNSKHAGFVRVALVTGSHLVPIVAFDEMSLLDNAKVPMVLQRWSMKNFRANFFVFPYGAAYLPIPRPLQVRSAFRNPMQPVRCSRREQFFEPDCDGGCSMLRRLVRQLQFPRLRILQTDSWKPCTNAITPLSSNCLIATSTNATMHPIPLC
eukprot:m.487527 g.487527  ORF g.487527 m.487527 type:complete len:665 (+) comp57225_c0_seq1:169-2163(+)